MTLHDGMHKVGGVSLKMRPVRRGILNKLVVPNQNRREESKRKKRAGCACVSEQALGRGVCMWLCSGRCRRVWRQDRWRAWEASTICYERRSLVRNECCIKAHAWVGFYLNNTALITYSTFLFRIK
jgi:hypothetical protein